MKTRWLLPLAGAFLLAVVRAEERDKPASETAAGWVKYPKNPVLGGDLGTCFDISVLKEGDSYRMWFSWRPKKSIALVESQDGVKWSKPLIVLGPNAKTDWENDINRPVVLKNGDRYQMWYTGQARGHSWIGQATSPDGKTWQRSSAKPVASGGHAETGLQGVVTGPSLVGFVGPALPAFADEPDHGALSGHFLLRHGRLDGAFRWRCYSFSASHDQASRQVHDLTLDQVQRLRHIAYLPEFDLFGPGRKALATRAGVRPPSERRSSVLPRSLPLPPGLENEQNLPRHEAHELPGL